jgi:L-aminopeptidase/D-esterase-like protein
MNDSGDIFLAFSTANRGAAATSGLSHVTALSNEELDPLFEATVQASEEAIVNALVAAESMTGADGHSVIAMPHERVRQLLRQHGVLKEDSARK